MIYPRQIENQLLNSETSKKITIILGARQVGKTTLLKKILENINHPKLSLDLDIFENKTIFSSYNDVITYLKFNGYKESENFVLFLDEFQTVKGIDVILKNLYDNQPNLKIFATGSSSLEINTYLKESLAGRKQIFNLFPLTFEEFIEFKDQSLFEKINTYGIENLPESIKNILNQMIKEYCIFGGYPEVATTSNFEMKKEVLRDIFDLFVKKDLISTLSIKNPEAVLNILKFLAINSGSIINYSTLCTSNHVDINTLKKYLTILNETFIIKTVLPFFRNRNKEIVKAPKIYFIDPGVRNYFLKNFSDFDSRTDNSFLLENFVLSQMLKKGNFLTEIKFWRDKNGREVDFIIEQENEITAFEVKNRKTITKKMVSNLLFFSYSYPESKLILTNLKKPGLDIERINEKEYFEI